MGKQMKLYVRVLALSITMMASSSVGAQDGSETITQRTTDGAQRFMEALPPISVFHGLLSLQTVRVKEVRALGDCMTLFELSPSDDQIKNGVLDKISIDWSTVTQVKNYHDENDQAIDAVTIHSTKTLHPSNFSGQEINWISLNVGSSNAIKRWIAAADFLRTKCDKAKDTGF